jgi:hypothetical protein
MASKAKGLNINIKAEDIVYTSIQKSRDNYNSARVVSKVAEKSYMTVSVEWEGDAVPAFAMDLMGTLVASEMAAGKVVAGREGDYAEYLERGGESAAKKCPECGASCDS